MKEEDLKIYNTYINDDSTYGIGIIEGVVTKYGGPTKGNCGCKQIQRINYLNRVKEWFNGFNNINNDSNA